MKTPDLISLLKSATEKLLLSNVEFAVAGGLVASLYREQSRFTDDIDLLFLSASSEEDASQMIRDLGFEASPIKLHQLKRLPRMNKKREPAFIIIGRSTKHSYGLDFILPTMPWFKNALNRAKKNQLDFGFGPLPCLTIEDVILAKAYAARAKDEDDLISIFAAKHEIDYPYLMGEMNRLELSFSKTVMAAAPQELRKNLRKRIKT